MKSKPDKCIVFDPRFLEGKEDFVMLTHFCYHAREQGWKETEIKEFIHLAFDGDDTYLFNTIKEHCTY